MSEKRPILDTAYWQERLRLAKLSQKLHHAVYVCDDTKWVAVNKKHERILAERLEWNDSILDAGCGYGRLVELLPHNWQGSYFGIDQSPDLIQEAKTRYPHKRFACCDLRNITNVIPCPSRYDWAICISMKAMIIREVSSQLWEQIETELKKVARNILILEYDANEEGEVIKCV